MPKRSETDKAKSSLMYRLLLGLSLDELNLLRWCVDKQIEDVQRIDERTVRGYRSATE